MKKFLLSLFCSLIAFASIQAEEATLSFANTAQRVSYSDSQQIWGQNGITFTNNKASSSTKIGDYAPVRVYKNSEVIIECSLGNITQIIFDCNKSDHATTLQNSIGNVATNSSDKVTVTLAGASNRFTFTPSAAIWIDELTVTYIVDSGETPSVPEVTIPSAPSLTASCNFDNSMKVEITAEEGATIHYTTDGSDPTIKSSVYSAAINITETTTVKAIAVNEGGSSDVVEATYTKNVTTPETPNEKEVTDVLDRTLTGVTGTTYSDWSGKTDKSKAVYAGNSAGGNESIQLRTTNNNSGIITTVSGGKVKKVVVVWNSNTKDGRTLDIYGKSTPYSSAADLYGNNSGTMLGSIVYGTSTEIEITEDYEYIGLRSQKDAMYLTSISIIWDASNAVETVAQPVISPSETEYTVGEEIEVEITTETEGATIYYTLDGTEPTTDSNKYNEALKISETKTVKAFAIKDGCVNSAIATKVFTFKNLITLENASVAEVIAAYNPEINKITNGATVIGYIVGTNDGLGNKTTATNLLLADTPEEDNLENCIAVELPTSNNIRAALNLVNNPGNYKRKVILTGNVEEYFKKAGLKSVKSYDFVIEGEWATMFRPNAGVAPTGYEAYIVVGVANGYAKLKQITGRIPAETGVILKRNENAVNDDSVDADVTGNLLEGSIASDTINAEAYVLGFVDKEVGLYKAKTEGFAEGTFVNNAGKAYLPASALGSASNIQFYGFRFDDEEGTTAIENVEVVTEEVIFDLSGRRISEITAPGIYIVNGKKVLVKN